MSRNSHEDLLEIYDFALYDTIETVLPMLKLIYGIMPTLGTKEIDTLEIYIISDSVIIIQKDTSMKGFLYLLAISRILLSSSIGGGIPLRGGISVDEVSVLKNEYGTTILGKGLTKAYEIENTQSWAGAIVSHECFEFLKEPEAKGLANRLCNVNNDILIRKFDVPFRNGTKENKYVIEWTNYDLIKSEQDVISSFSKHNKNCESERVQTIIKNTVGFYRWIQNRS
ncbi:hypothetical protein [Lentimicrobium sp. S6]|uniref:hypothetical protein n=1 Tax=Lentimicrobium sp. S6 TaxID=2735872 RepID=UPI001556E71A|nr:hypothetical protein [Lentimicrobium sp. S6]NPD47325.1 hypothetical protein [Lentimicrobium sp. S6]